MAFSFKDVSVSVFDAHPAVAPLRTQSADYVHKGFEFLLDGHAYNAQYESGQPVPTGLGEFLPLAGRARRTHFWDAYHNPPDGGPQNAWRMLLPFVCRPKDEAVRHNLDGGPDLSITTRTAVYLSPVGWSTKVTFRFRGDVLRKTLIGLVESIVSKTTPRRPFLIGGAAANMTDLFVHFQTRMLEEVYSAANPPHGKMKVPRHHLISLNKFVGDPVEYDSMTDDELALMRGILFGREIGAVEAWREQREEERQKRPLLRTRISNPYNFALTNFDHGTLVFLQRDAVDEEREGAVHCHNTNVSDCLMMAFALLSFHQQSKGAAAGTPLAAVRDAAQAALRNLYDNYTNQLCENIFRQHDGLRTLVQLN